MRLCKDCFFYRRMTTLDICHHSDASSRNPVSGTAFADIEREPMHKCGPHGLLFKPGRPSLLRRIARVIEALSD